MRHAVGWAFILGAWLLVGCAPSVSVTVSNRGNARLDSLRIVGEAGTKQLRDMAPGESLRVSVPVTSEDVLQLRGRLGGRPLPRGFGGYVEPGYRMRIQVSPDGSQTITAQLPGTY